MTNLIDELVRGYCDLRGVLLREVDADEAADLAQSAFEQALRYVQGNEVKSPAGLLFSIARNLRIDHIRRRARIAWQSSDGDTEILDRFAQSELTPERHHTGRRTLNQLCEILDGLPPRCREAFILCKVHGMSYEDAANEMGISCTVVRKYLMTAMRECRRLLA